MEVISQIPWPALSCLSASSTVVFMSEIDAVDVLSAVILSDDSLRLGASGLVTEQSI